MLHQNFNFRSTSDEEEKEGKTTLDGLVFVTHDKVDHTMYEELWFQIPPKWYDNRYGPKKGKFRRRREVGGEYQWHDHFAHTYTIRNVV